jgi:hypothetical protein
MPLALVQQTESVLTWLIYRIFQKTTEYLDHFARFKTTQAAEAIGQLLAAHKELEKFERAQLGTYAPAPAPRPQTRASADIPARFPVLRLRRGGQDAHPQPDGQDRGRGLARAAR